MKSYNGVLHCQQHQQKKGTTAQNALQCLCCLHANTLHIGSPHTGSCQLPWQINCQEPNAAVNHEAVVTIVTFHIPKMIKLQCGGNHGRLIRQNREKKS